jgi:hypothetical protein
VGGQCRWRSDEEFRSADGLTRRSGGWINRIGHLTRGAGPGGVEIDLPGAARTKAAEDFEDRNLIGYHVGRIDYE